MQIPFFSQAQSDQDQDQKAVETYLFTGELKKAKSLIDEKFVKSENKSRQVIGYVCLASYYSSVKDENKQLCTLKIAEKIARETGDDLDLAYVEYGYAKYYGFAKKHEDLFVKSISKGIQLFKKYPNENYKLAILYSWKISYLKSKYPVEKPNLQDYSLYENYSKKSKDNTLISLAYVAKGALYLLNMPTRNTDSAEANYKKGIYYANRIQYILEKKKVLINIYYYLGTLATIKKEYTKALEIFNTGLQYRGEYAESKLVEYSYYCGIGHVYEETGEYQKGLDNYLKAYKIRNSENITDKQRMMMLTNIYYLYKKQKQYDKSLTYLEEAVKLDEKSHEENIKSLNDFYKNENEKNLLYEKNKAYGKQRIFYFGIITLAVISIIFLFFLILYRQKRQIQV